ncbi:hypothetical protein Pyn_31265 [Prunus yedoensis var. nudiflora]|uniref:Uncharacterized protein n=1 Tax=Prunus yedoensis var. nudiflora TaxID=2094558 RepID=A0A314YAM4_PRUYE|nr:hypothetical protein Pyn_31265 [Prunus yedoensis var. nudiflora]
MQSCVFVTEKLRTSFMLCCGPLGWAGFRRQLPKLRIRIQRKRTKKGNRGQCGDFTIIKYNYPPASEAHVGLRILFKELVPKQLFVEQLTSKNQRILRPETSRLAREYSRKHYTKARSAKLNSLKVLLDKRR